MGLPVHLGTLYQFNLEQTQLVPQGKGYSTAGADTIFTSEHSTVGSHTSANKSPPDSSRGRTALAILIRSLYYGTDHLYIVVGFGSFRKTGMRLAGAQRTSP